MGNAIHETSIKWMTQLVFILLIHWVEISPVDSAIQRMNYRDISLRGRLRGKKGEGIGEGRKGIPPLSILSLLYVTMRDIQTGF